MIDSGLLKEAFMEETSRLDLGDFAFSLIGGLLFFFFLVPLALAIFYNAYFTFLFSLSLTLLLLLSGTILIGYRTFTRYRELVRTRK